MNETPDTPSRKPKENQMNTTIVKFKMAENLLRDVIMRQAGTIDKAILEGAMNLVEAGATKGTITLDNTKIVIEDDGKGFESEDEIRDAFETFGKTDERAKEEKRWARFQMGRGQLFAFGKTTYRTRTFEMITDIHGAIGIGYEFKKDLPDVPGCVVTVELYNPIDNYQIATIVRDVKRNIAYVPLEITVNGDLVTTNVADVKWTFEDDDAYVKVNESARELKIYNLGVFVEEKYLSGVGGILVSKRQLDVNFARNQVMESCPIYRRVRTMFRAKTKKPLIERQSYGAKDAASVLDGFESHEYTANEIFWKPLLQTTEQKKVSFGKLFEHKMYSTDERGGIKAAQAMRTQDVLVLDSDHLSTVLGGSGRVRFERLMEFVKNAQPYATGKPPSYVPSDELYVDIVETRSVLEPKDLSKRARIALKVINDAFSPQFLRFSNGNIKHREIVIGESSNAEVTWTDGMSYIAIKRDYLEKKTKRTGDWAVLILDIAHSYAHESSTRDHDDEFFQRFHDNVEIFVTQTGDIVRSYVKKCLEAGILNVRYIAVEDRASSILGANEDTTEDEETSTNDEPPTLGLG